MKIWTRWHKSHRTPDPKTIKCKQCGHSVKYIVDNDSLLCPVNKPWPPSARYICGNKLFSCGEWLFRSHATQLKEWQDESRTLSSQEMQWWPNRIDYPIKAVK